VANFPPVSTIPVANLPPVSTTPAANFATSFAKVVDTGGKIATGVDDGKFAAGILLTPLANLPLVLTTPAVQVAKFATCVVYTGGKFAVGVVDTGCTLKISPRIFQKKSK
jgi:hypothetical protein